MRLTMIAAIALAFSAGISYADCGSLSSTDGHTVVYSCITPAGFHPGDGAVNVATPVSLTADCTGQITDTDIVFQTFTVTPRWHIDLNMAMNVLTGSATASAYNCVGTSVETTGNTCVTANLYSNPTPNYATLINDTTGTASTSLPSPGLVPEIEITHGFTLQP